MYEEEKCNNNCYYTGCKQRKNRCCIDVIIFILSILFAAIATLIVLAIILAILIVIRIIQLVCNRNKCC